MPKSNNRMMICHSFLLEMMMMSHSFPDRITQPNIDRFPAMIPNPAPLVAPPVAEMEREMVKDGLGFRQRR